MALFDNDSVLSFNFTNWITVGIIALTLFFALGLIQKHVQGKVNNATS